MKTNVELNDEICADAGQILNLILADEYVLYTTTWSHYWNLAGPKTQRFHLLLDQQCAQIGGWIDHVAERGRILAVAQQGTWRELTKPARFSDFPGSGLSARQMLAEILALHDELIGQLYVDSEDCLARFSDAATAAFLIGLMVKHIEAAGALRLELEAYAFTQHSQIGRRKKTNKLCHE